MIDNDDDKRKGRAGGAEPPNGGSPYGVPFRGGPVLGEPWQVNAAPPEVRPAPKNGAQDFGRLAEMFEKSPVALTLADVSQPDMPLVLVNSVFLDMTGYSRSEVIGRNCRFLQDDLPNDEARAETRDTIAHGGQSQIVFRNRRKTGEEFDNLLFLQGLLERRGGTRYFLGSQFRLERTVSERKIDGHVAQIDAVVARAIESHMNLRSEQRRMYADAAHAVANAWLALR